MHYLCCSKNLTNCVRLLAAAVLLRSFIAPGFMLSVSPEDGLGIVFCNGLAGIHAPDDSYAGGHDGHHAGHHHPGDIGKADHRGHVTPTCGHWSVSSLFVASALFVPSLDVPLPATTKANYQSTQYQKFPDSPRVTRGPPTA